MHEETILKEDSTTVLGGQREWNERRATRDGQHENRVCVWILFFSTNHLPTTCHLNDKDNRDGLLNLKISRFLVADQSHATTVPKAFSLPHNIQESTIHRSSVVFSSSSPQSIQPHRSSSLVIVTSSIENRFLWNVEFSPTFF
jgi:hypothetical protein